MLPLKAALIEITRSTEAFVEMRKGLLAIHSAGSLNFEQTEILKQLVNFTNKVEKLEKKRKNILLKNSLSLDVETSKN